MAEEQKRLKCRTRTPRRSMRQPEKIELVETVATSSRELVSETQMPSDRDTTHSDRSKSAEVCDASTILNASSSEFLDFVDNCSIDQLHKISGIEPAQKPQGLISRFPSVAVFLHTGDGPRQCGAIIRWWETKRLMYNLMVGLAGLPTVFVMLRYHELYPDLRVAQPAFITFYVINYAVMANLCYTLGPISELFAGRSFGKSAGHVGSVLWMLGTVFSVAMTLLVFVVMGTGLFVGLYQSN